MKLILHPVNLILKEAFTISRGSYSERKSLIVELQHDGKSGFGEAIEHSYYRMETPALFKHAQELRPVIENYSFDTPEKYWEYLSPYFSGPGFLQCAIDNAAHDLYGKLLGKPCHEIWGLDSTKMPKSSYTVTIDSIDKMVSKVKTLNYDIYKVKLGTPHDMEIMEALRENTDSILRVDANCAWTAEQTIQYAVEMKELGVEYIEQALKADDWAGAEKVYAETVLPVLADEACIREEDLDKCAPHFHGINIKLMKCGGLTPALRMVAKARALGLKLMCGCMMESSVGISAIAQFLPLLDYADMDSALFLTNDPAKGAVVQADGSVILPDAPGLGIEFDSSASRWS